MAHHAWNPECKVYVGGLKEEANRYDLEDAFSKIGKVVNVWVARRPPGFGFVEMEDPRDALDCVKELDGTRICGGRVKVEMSKPDRGGRGRDGGRGGRDGDRGGDRGGRDRRERYKSRSRSRTPERRRRRSPSYRSMSPRRN
ncbi:probable splicing factor, arginine/serine-rich 6 [Eurytemora carolleeae]|uniref:probable splicing factor, arginine/serine-rich 6 n=1 Tax=Eurytemora carolleeae TaxID=1294199 RepID=UPI000C7681E4|nr:probable splicing factor, arginine/serine-rich 6 [Eurytemora carolleeae]|eukprot:XP_023343472.1 probable splicing factor, arginine/serine-rich 6 [Eurytemora affinis]